MKNIPSPIQISDYNYPLNEQHIARFPLSERDASRLLVYKERIISDLNFKDLPAQLPDNSLLVFNNTRVIRARLIFHKPAGARIEIFCLQPLGAYGQTGGFSSWKCLIGNAKRWKTGTLQMEIPTPDGNILLTVTRGAVLHDAHQVDFTWDQPEMPFEQLLEYAGKVPLPPYLNREPEESDAERYQTVYALLNGSVAAPTAGLHFTPTILQNLEERGVVSDYLTLHVGAGTFKPVSSGDVSDHQMHEEEIIVEKGTLLRLLQNLHGNIIPVGTTSMRSLESLYWFGVQLINGNEPEADEGFVVKQWEPYYEEVIVPTAEALQAIFDFMSRKRISSIHGITGIMIVPGYRFRICKALVTNFHQPQSTLLLLVAAFIGPRWKEVYQFALENGFRFLSYGDSCLFFPKNEED